MNFSSWRKGPFTSPCDHRFRFGETIKGSCLTTVGVVHGCAKETEQRRWVYSFRWAEDVDPSDIKNTRWFNNRRAYNFFSYSESYPTPQEYQRFINFRREYFIVFCVSDNLLFPYMKWRWQCTHDSLMSEWEMSIRLHPAQLFENSNVGLETSTSPSSANLGVTPGIG